MCLKVVKVCVKKKGWKGVEYYNVQKIKLKNNIPFVFRLILCR